MRYQNPCSPAATAPIDRLAPLHCPHPVDKHPGSPKFMNKLLRTCRSLCPRRPRTGSHYRLPLFRLPRAIQRVGGRHFKSFGVYAHSSHRFGLLARTAPALTSRLPFPPGCVLRLCLLDFKAVIFASHQLLSRLLAPYSFSSGGSEVYSAPWEHLEAVGQCRITPITLS